MHTYVYVYMCVVHLTSGNTYIPVQVPPVVLTELRTYI